MITEELLKECRLEFEESFQTLIMDSHENQTRVEDVRAHALRVVENTRLLAKFVLSNEEDVRIAELIALFHDLGRAALIVQGTESPTNISRDHAALSVKLMQQMDFYAGLSPEAQLVIVKAIDSHNKLKLPKLDNEQVTLFARLLRDADKLDVFESSYRFFKDRQGVQPMMTFDLINTAEVSEKILRTIIAGKSALAEDMKTMNDYKLLLLSMSFDLNFKYTYRLLSEKQYIQKIYETLPKRDLIIDAYRGIKLFVENKFVS